MNQQGADNPREQAAAWFVRMQDAPDDSALRERLQHWLDERPEHRQEYELLGRLWCAADFIPPERLEALCEPEPVRQLPRRRLLRQALAAGVALAALGLGWGGWQYQQMNHHDVLATQAGERRMFELPDGSRLELNSATRIDVAFSAGRRQLRLLAGEAMFSVAHDSGRPFVVDTAQGSVTVTGTRFDVRQDNGLTRVAVEQGSVKVEGAAGSLAQLGAGQGAHIDHQGKVAAPYTINAAALTAWRQGKLVFDNATLTEVVSEVSRYRSHPLYVAPGKVANLRLSSTFSTDDPDALLRALPNILPVAVKTHSDGSSEIIAK
ncbi:FecR family protein [Pseudomonas putida]|uniref:FecR family protein n=1 Tax=Pseudomonas putida TaxID=303 RepID=UPI0008194BD1|nr:FecR family protein [Pseudomonas putida]OCT21546.1 peptide ABC transporter substrate-binding protein [Pseudomonas putida]OCT22992.1 peptide ABC transporter substrate-binding protein [Pseudomonas putida]OCT23317.1 peptide ABC transporter substrate-binding protein [Pseudomonas putida]OCT36279.1 peptide ABC transporter substrate-binding protein [Pseudomonas putida]